MTPFFRAGYANFLLIGQINEPDLSADIWLDKDSIIVRYGSLGMQFIWLTLDSDGWCCVNEVDRNDRMAYEYVAKWLDAHPEVTMRARLMP